MIFRCNTTHERINKLNFFKIKNVKKIKNKNVRSVEGTVKKMKGLLGENICKRCI